MANEDKVIETIPVGPLGLVPLKSCEELGKKVDAYLVRWRTARQSEHKSTIAFAEYQKDSYIIKTKLSRFGTGEGKGTILESVRGDDLYLMVDVCNHSLTYSLCGMQNHILLSLITRLLLSFIQRCCRKGETHQRHHALPV